MNRLRWLGGLMIITLLAVTGFQLYWLRENYSREEKSLALRTDAAFKETILHLRVARIKLDGFNSDSSNKSQVKIFMNDEEEGPKIRVSPEQGIVSTINVIRDKMIDSLKALPGGPKRMVISMNTTSMEREGESMRMNRIKPGQGHDRVFSLLYGVDSLQDSLKVKDIQKAYAGTLKRQKLEVPFSVLRLDSTSSESDFNEVTVGFAKPVTYRLQLGNTFPYLFRKISLAVLFSILLLGITILSFVLLYRNLLKQRRLAAIKNEFINNITHELKTPIATVSVAIEALRNFGAAQNPEKTKEYLDISASELQRLGLLVDKVLKLSMFENHEVELKKELFDMKELVNEVLQIMKLQFEKHHAEVNVKIAGNNFFIEADRLHITSVLYNLLDNALKYGNENPRINLELSSLAGDIIELKVSDDGRGIPKEYQSRVFDKFFRVPDGNRHNVKGYGLGLSYVKEIVTSHRGYIDVQSEPGKGSTFTIRLPLKDKPVIDFGNDRKIIKEKISFGT